MDGSFLFDETREEMAWFFRPSAPVYVRPELRRGTLWGELVRIELRFIWMLRRAVDHAGAGFVLRQFISNSPYRDVSLLTWVVAGLGLYEYGIKMVWILLPNLFVCAFLRSAFQCPRPFEYDRQLRPLADRHMACYGFPSIESHMAVVVFGYIAHRLGGGSSGRYFWNGWQVGTALAAWFVGATRVYAGSRFPHQVLLSWGLGALSLWVYISRLEPLVPDWGGSLNDRHLRVALLAPWVLALLAYVGLNMEDNDSNLWRVPNSEFVRVMTHIMDVGAAASQRDGLEGNPRDRATGQRRNNGGVDDADSDGGEDDSALLGAGGGRGGRISGDRGGRAGAQTNSEQEHRGEVTRLERRRQRLSARQDGFYFLQHAMRRKAIERDALREHWSRERSSTEANSDDAANDGSESQSQRDEL